MLNYQAAYRMQMGAFFGEVSGFGEVSAIGPTLEAARSNLLSALRYAAERALRRGEALPLPVPGPAPADAYLIETLTLVPEGGDRVSVRLGG